MNTLLDAHRLNIAARWIEERESMRKHKAAGGKPPHSQYPAMADVRYCNVRRMDDKVSIWLMDRLYRGGYTERRTAVVACAVGRMVNLPQTLGFMYPYGFRKWDREHFRKYAHRVKHRHGQVFTGAYIIHGGGVLGASKIDVVGDVIESLHKLMDKRGRPVLDDQSMRTTYSQLQQVSGIGSFMAGQIVADLRHVVQGTWWDKDDFAPQGPGSTRGLLWLAKSEANGLSTLAFNELFAEYLHRIRQYPAVRAIHADRGLEAHDYQNTLCELSKYVRVTTGGRAKNHYPSKRNADTDEYRTGDHEPEAQPDASA